MRREESRRLLAGLLARAEAKARSPRSTMDLLIISGGGDWGAFGAGVLKGWGRVTGEKMGADPASWIRAVPD